MKLFRSLIPAALAMLTLFAFSSYGDGANDIDVTLTDSELIATPGSVVTFYATAYNPNDYVMNLNGDSSNVDSPLTLDDSPFFNDWFSINADSSFDTTADALFNVDVPLGTAPGIYDGTFNILGGPGGSDANLLATVNFSVDVPGATSPVPEPSLGLLTAFLTGALLISRSRYRSAGPRP